ncbi:hypothetical protein F4561_005815 [Lipingzhangella halophila]|uniref:Uncharacterized protein n=1 Tax=Lipingzhangella halophila TaxID=1783352 RepID=A0A7W7W5L9_9ACTN|nr:DUF2306 domain-containing protein [Lipingzhangella halophila]MBB4934921.1 hypothetical protein [Lipingzhangella halophila]
MATTTREASPPNPPGASTRTRPRWWRRPWILPLGLATVVFLSFSVPPYLTLDPELSRFPIRDDFPLHYPFMVTHIFAGSIVMLAVCLQVWPWLRQNYPAVHRWSGRTYVMIGIPLVGLPSLVLAPLSHSGLGGQVSNTLWGILWLTCTIVGYRMVRQRRYAEHREWMLRSFALIFAIAMNRLWSTAAVITLMPQLDTTFGGDQQMLIMIAGSTSSWLSWVLNLLIVEWWIQYRRRGRRTPSRQKARPAQEDATQPA